MPAICTIVESLPAGRRARVLLEVPGADDVLDLAAPEGVEVTWLPRSRGAGGSAPRGSLLTAAVVEAAAELADLLAPSPVAALEDVDVDSGILWEVPAEAGVSPGSSGVYAWLAGEAGVVTGLRRHLVQELGVDRRSVAFMGYWREGRESD